LLVEVNRQKARASEGCKREHESFGECLATKLSAKASVLNSLSFSARTQLEKALTTECQAQQGTCLGVEATDPVCRDVGGAVATPAASPEPAAEAVKAEPAKVTPVEAPKKEDPKAKPAPKKKAEPKREIIYEPEVRKCKFF
jgi:outer membrane biosynthesis protein TonB